jgi:dTDP-4-amino-4,6-dideoxygalactose transaminase
MRDVPFLDITGQDSGIVEDIQTRFGEICRSGRFALGPFVEDFERDFAAYCGVSHAVALNSGTSALHLALLCLDVGPGDEVITTPMTFVATAWAISYVGATPVFVDIDPVRRTMDPDRLEAAITSRTKAILPVHLYGMPADMTPICEIATRHGIPLIEDAAQAHGARYRGRRVGGFADAGCFSFYPGKNLGAYGEGGALVTNRSDIADKARMLRDHAQRKRYLHESIGFNYRMDALQGAVLGVKLAHLDNWNAARRRHAEHYRERLIDAPGIKLPIDWHDCESVWHLFVVEVDERERVQREMLAAGIHTGLHYPTPVHLQPAYQHLGYSEGSFPNAERLARRCLSLPMYPHLSPNQLLRVCVALAETQGVPSWYVAPHDDPVLRPDIAVAEERA